MNKKVPSNQADLVGQTIVLGVVALLSSYTFGFGFTLVIGISVLVFAIRDRRAGAWVSAGMLLAAGIIWIVILATWGVFVLQPEASPPFGVIMDVGPAIEEFIEKPLVKLLGILP